MTCGSFFFRCVDIVLFTNSDSDPAIWASAMDHASRVPRAVWIVAGSSKESNHQEDGYEDSWQNTFLSATIGTVFIHDKSQ